MHPDGFSHLIALALSVPTRAGWVNDAPGFYEIGSARRNLFDRSLVSLHLLC
jgi:hypothetical protein